MVKLLVEMIEPYKGRIYDPCCGSSGMFVQSEEFIEAHGGRVGDLSIYGQESNNTTWRLAKMNLAIRGIEANLGPHNGDTFHNDLHKDLKADFILANPPFNMSAGLQAIPTRGLGHPKDVFRQVLVSILRVGIPVCRQAVVQFLERVGNVLEENETKDDVLVFGRVHVAAQLVGRSPKLPLETEVRSIAVAVL